ncbi:hypothetical protein [Psychrobacter sp.]|uniref:hypothetical protein n=1 Tax=Psychrobacter sp. TaxID=56811 RepID=UPI00356498B5
MFNLPATHSKYTRYYRPQHSLARRIIAQIDKYERRPQDIIKAMGYPLKHTIPACDRLRHVLSSEKMGLDGSYIDAYFTPEQFLEKLVLILDMHEDAFKQDIAQITYDLAHCGTPLPKYYLKADIDFEFTAGANWMSRGGAAQLAHVHLPENIARMTETEREVIVQKCIDEHYKNHNGNLPYGGVIKGYWLTIEQHSEMIGKVAYGLPVKS